MMVSAVMPDGWSMHKLRHRYATRGLDRTGNLLLVRDALGHASVATTQIYTKIVTEQMRTIADAAADDDS
jgi:site-specific recombinase XerC